MLVTTETRMGGKFLLRWSIQAIVAGVGGAVLVRSFELILTFLPVYRAQPLVHPVADAILAALVTGIILYRIAPGAAGEGIPAYLDAIRDRDGSLPFKDTVIKFPAALLALGLWGSGGMVGPLGRVTAGVSQSATFQLQKLFPRLFADHDVENIHYYAPTSAVIAGMAAAVAAVFGAPIAGAVFAVEVIQRDQLRYHQLFPAILSSSLAVFFMEVMGWSAPFRVVVTAYAPEALVIVPIALVGILSGFTGRVYTALYRFMSDRFRRRHHTGRVPRLVIGMVGAAAAGLLVHPMVFGTSARLSMLLSTGSVESLAVGWLPAGGVILLLVLLWAKMIANCVTVASGMSAGFTGPAALIGMFVGAAVAVLLGYVPGGHSYTTLVVAGFAGTLASTMNIPLAASILAMEVFAPSFGVPAGISAILGFQIARYSTIYDAALENRRAERGV